MRSTRKVSVWPVAFVGGLRYESPKINTMGKVYGWRTVFDPHRPFAIDMAGFAINLKLILSKPQAYFKLKGVKGGYQESSLLRELVTLGDLEPKADNCTKVTPCPSSHSTHAGTVLTSKNVPLSVLGLRGFFGPFLFCIFPLLIEWGKNLSWYNMILNINLKLYTVRKNVDVNYVAVNASDREKNMFNIYHIFKK